MAGTELSGERQWVLKALQEYELPLLRFAMRLVGEEDSAREVVQHTFFRLCEQTHADLQGRVSQWLFMVCYHKAVDVLRSRSRHASEAAVEPADCPSREPDPADAAQRQELHRRLNMLVDTLPPDQRATVVLWSEGHAYRDIAAIVHHSEGNVRVLVHRALKHLRSQPFVRQLLHEPAVPLRPTLGSS